MSKLKELLGEEKFREYMSELSKLGVAKRKKYFSQKEKAISSIRKNWEYVESKKVLDSIHHVFKTATRFAVVIEKNGYCQSPLILK